jgi:NAD(P) transhydrogenase
MSPSSTGASYDLIVLGSGPSGQRAAVQAAKLGKTVAVVEQQYDLGGVCINSGTIPSKTLREAIIDLAGLRQRALYGDVFHVKEITAQDLLMRADVIMRREREVVRAQLQRNHVVLVPGSARFDGPNDVVADGPLGPQKLHGTFIIIATGTTPGVPPGISVDHERVLTSDDILKLPRLPRSLAVVGAGVIGVEYATMFAALAIEVTLLDMRTELLEMVDREIVNALTYQANAMGVTLRLGEEVAAIETNHDRNVVVALKSGKRFAAEMVLVSAGRQGATGSLALERAGLNADARGRIAVNEHYQTSVPHIYAVGDVIGFPALASTSSEQGRHAAAHAFGVDHSSVPALFPYGIYAIPEIGWVGEHERALTEKDVPFETGIARYKEIARGQILGDVDGMLKLIFHLKTRQLLGVWGIGTQATELVHIGQAVMALGGTLDYFVNNVFNYPTLAECYKVAALDGANKLRDLGLYPEPVAASGEHA